MDVNNIFNLFDSGSEQHISGSESNQRLVDIFKDHPIIKIGYFKKLIKNYSVYWLELVNFFQKEKEKLDINDIKKAGEFLLFSKAWENISYINIKDPYHIECLISLADDDLYNSFTFCIKHFETLEEYERCGFIKNLRDRIFSLK